MVGKNKRRYINSGRSQGHGAQLPMGSRPMASRRSPSPRGPDHELSPIGEAVLQSRTERFAARDFSSLIGMEGFSEALLRNHFELYKGYVENANKLLEELQGSKEGPGFAELKRRFGWEYNGIRLHEFYFENLTREPKALEPAGRLSERLREDFGGFENWRKDFQATGAMRGIGWVVLYKDPLRNRLFNAWIDEHDTGHLAGALPILVMDVFEHAFMLDYGVKKAGYIEAFFKAVHWDAVAARLT